MENERTINQTIEGDLPETVGTPAPNTTSETPKRTRKNLSKNIKDMSMEELKALNTKQNKEIVELKNLVNMYKHNAEEAYAKMRAMDVQLEQTRMKAKKAIEFVKTNVKVLFTTIDLLEKELNNNAD